MGAEFRKPWVPRPRGFTRKHEKGETLAGGCRFSSLLLLNKSDKIISSELRLISGALMSEAAATVYLGGETATPSGRYGYCTSFSKSFF